MSRPVALITSPTLVGLSEHFERTPLRATATQQLINAYSLSDKLKAIQPQPASVADLLQFHRKEYIELLRLFSPRSKKEIPSQDSLNDYGLDYECPAKRGLFEYVTLMAGATLTGCDFLTDNRHNSPIAINWSGGWHHARENRAAGFCYANDCVLACMKLKSYGSVLYVDLDVHHCDAVEDAFLITGKVVTVSLHHYAPGFYPNTGDFEDCGQGRGYGYALNLPFHVGLSDDQYSRVVMSVFPKLKEVYKPDFVVLQCGADSLAKDPLGGFSLTSAGYKVAVQEILNFNIPTLILGGGGYNAQNAARLWTEITALTVGVHLTEELPDFELLGSFGPDYSIKVENSTRSNENTDEYVDSVIADVLEFLSFDDS